MSASISRVNSDPQIADPTRTLLPNKAKWYQTERAAKITGVALVAIGAVAAAAATATLILFAPVTFAAALSCAALALGISAIAAGVLLYRKNCWNDQSFVDKASQKAQNMTFGGIVDKYTLDQLQSGHIISRGAINNKFSEEVRARNLDLKGVREQFSNLILNGLVDYTAIYEIYKSELIAKKAEFKESNNKFLQHYIDCGAPLHTIPKNDPWIREYLRDLIVDKNYSSMRYMMNVLSSNLPAQTFLTKEMIKNELEAQFEKSGRNFKEFHTKHCQGGSLKEILENRYIEISALRESFKDATKEMKFVDIIKNFGWSIFDKIPTANFTTVNGRNEVLMEDGLASAADFTARFKEEEADTKLSDLLSKYKYPNASDRNIWSFIDYALVNSEWVKAKALAEIEADKLTYEEIQVKFGYPVFLPRTAGIGIKDPEVQKAIYRTLQKLGKLAGNQFTFLNKLNQFIYPGTEDNHPLVQLRTVINGFDPAFKAALQAYNKAIEEAKTTLDAALVKAEEEKKAQLKTLREPCFALNAQIRVLKTNINEINEESAKHLQRLQDELWALGGQVEVQDPTRPVDLVAGRVPAGSGIANASQPVGGFSTAVSSGPTLVNGREVAGGARPVQRLSPQDEMRIRTLKVQIQLHESRTLEAKATINANLDLILKELEAEQTKFFKEEAELNKQHEETVKALRKAMEEAKTAAGNDLNAAYKEIDDSFSSHLESLLKA